MLSFIKKILLWDKIWFPLLSHTPIISWRYILKWFVAKNILYGDVSKGMIIVGITGTDGKTTTCNILHKVISDNLGKCAMISTAGLKIWNTQISNETKKTSLDILDLYKFLSQAKAENCQYVVIEASSHGLEQYRFWWVDFNIWALTNITAEHMDYHRNIQEYANTKKKLFTGILSGPNHPKMAVFPKDDDFGRKWSEELLFDKSMDYWIKNSAAIRAENIKIQINKTEYDIKYLWVNYPIVTNLLWEFNIYNALAATSIGLLLGIEINNIIKSISSFESVNGRMNIYINQDITYIVDFAHTPKAFESLLTFANNVKWYGRLIVVFGSAWRWWEYKRPQMWNLADQLADIVIVTEDDSMSENTDNIIKQITKWITRNLGDKYHIINSRPLAIQMSTNIAEPSDIVLIVGKGHENYLYTNFGKFPHNDMDYLKSIFGK